ncbi:conserved hypothetical protein [Candidatus Desulfarcum epimagneticum]|uniref:DUF4390 domain-containing protein n=1 Tax=uncultured Desulfobacteraceae bacterium TaxID=218296 RepID=A0A484HEM2_9BACT|nr:conserved hypothetical protein [uncultured Desulfobacteraceae bacterium]
MRPNAFIKIFVIVFSIIILPLHSMAAQEATLENIIVTNTRDDLLIYLNVEGAFSDKIKKVVLSGVPAAFSFFIILNRVRDFWGDKEISDIKVTHSIKYNTLKKEYVIKRSWENNKPLVTKSFVEARKLMTEVDSLRIVPLKRLDKGGLYQIRAKAELSKFTLPFYLHYVLFFLSFWDFETDWYTIDFTY